MCSSRPGVHHPELLAVKVTDTIVKTPTIPRSCTLARFSLMLCHNAQSKPMPPRAENELLTTAAA
jgi:hypothetical protein